jgi:hypothetical protein
MAAQCPIWPSSKPTMTFRALVSAIIIHPVD